MFRTGSRLVALTLAAVAVWGLLATQARAQFNTYGELTLIHGLPGNELDNASLDLDFPNDLPVDICVGLPGTGTLNCFYADVKFGEIRGPLQLTVGTYQVDFRQADLVTPGSGNLIASATVTIESRDNRSAIFHVTTSRTPKVTSYKNDTSRLTFTSSRVVFRHNAQIGPVDMSVLSTIGMPGATATNLSNSQQSGVFNLATGPYTRYVRPAGNPTNLLAPVSVFLYPKNASVYYLVGSTDRGTLAVITQSYRP